VPGSSPVSAPLADLRPGTILDSLLKRPDALIEKLCRPDSGQAWLILALVSVLTFAFYGMLVGSFSGGSQLASAAVKISGGAVISMLICLPSFYIFSCLSGADISLRSIAGLLFGILALTGLLLLGFAPVAWVFSQSTNSLPFIGFMHIAFWVIGLWFGLRLLGHMKNTLRVTDRTHLNVWALIFILVSLQMTTALRPLIGTADTWLPKEKKFFMAHWIDNLSGSNDAKR
jgi:hypothetical protein